MQKASCEICTCYTCLKIIAEVELDFGESEFFLPSFSSSTNPIVFSIYGPDMLKYLPSRMLSVPIDWLAEYNNLTLLSMIR